MQQAEGVVYLVYSIMIPRSILFISKVDGGCNPMMYVCVIQNYRREPMRTIQKSLRIPHDIANTIKDIADAFDRDFSTVVN